jgi:5-methylcytosine-specific restriction protein A
VLHITLGPARPADSDDHLGREVVGFSPGMTAAELYEANRGRWVLGPRADEERFMLLSFEGIVRQAIEIDRLVPCGPRRRAAEGRVLEPGHPVYDEFVGKPSPVTGVRNPVTYFDAGTVEAAATAGARPPAWSWDETVLAYDLYLRDYVEPMRYPDGDQQAVQELSDLLRGLPLHPVAARQQERFRNPNGVARKMQNLMWEATGHQYGSPNGSAMDVRVVAELPDPTEVAVIAWAIKDAAGDLPATAAVADDGEEPSAVEGAILEHRHSRRERDRGLVRRKKEQLLRAGKPLVCEACGIDVAGTYDLHAGAVVECHHTRPLAEGVRETKLSDLALVCPNCHRALHSRSRWPSLADLRDHLQDAYAPRAAT